MADLTDLQAAQTVKIAGADNTGAETNYMDVDSSGRPTVKSQLYTASGSAINFGQALMAASIPVVIASNQSAIAIANFPTTVDTNFGTVGASTIRVASQIGNSTGAALYGAGTTTAQVLRVVLPTDQSAIPVTMLDVAPANGTITAFDAATTTLVGANGQNFYTGTPTAGSAVVFTLNSIENVTIQLNLLGGGGPVVLEVSMDGGTFWVRPNAYQISTQSYSTGFTAPFIATLNVMGMTHVRARAITSWAGTGTIIARESINSRGVTIEDSLPPGANVIGGVTQNGTWTVTAAEDKNYGTVGATTLRVASQIGNATGSADFNAGATGAQTLRVAANQGAPNTAANGWFTRLTDGTNNVAVKAASTAAVAADPSLVVALSPNSPLPAGSAIIGALVANQSVNHTQLNGSAAITGGVAGLMGVGGNVASAATDAGNPIKVGGVYNTTAPTFTNGQRGDIQVDSRGRLVTIECANLGTGTQGAITVTNAAIEVKVGGSRLAGRSLLTAHNNGTATIFWGYTSGVTTTTGTPLAQGQVGSWKVGDQQSVYLIATSGSQNVRVTEA